MYLLVRINYGFAEVMNTFQWKKLNLQIAKCCLHYLNLHRNLHISIGGVRSMTIVPLLILCSLINTWILPLSIEYRKPFCS